MMMNQIPHSDGSMPFVCAQAFYNNGRSIRVYSLKYGIGLTDQVQYLIGL